MTLPTTITAAISHFLCFICASRHLDVRTILFLRRAGIVKTSYTLNPAGRGETALFRSSPRPRPVPLRRQIPSKDSMRRQRTAAVGNKADTGQDKALVHEGEKYTQAVLPRMPCWPVPPDDAIPCGPILYLVIATNIPSCILEPCAPQSIAYCAQSRLPHGHAPANGYD